jgi:hypothetical protein
MHFSGNVCGLIYAWINDNVVPKYFTQAIKSSSFILVESTISTKTQKPGVGLRFFSLFPI